MYFMAPLPNLLPNLLKRRMSSNTTPASKNHGSSWKLQRRLLSSLPKSALRPILLPHDDDGDDAEESALSNSKTTTIYQDHPLRIDTFWPPTLKSTVQPQSVSAHDHVLTVGSASAVECIRMPPEPSLGSNHQHGPDSCASSLSCASSHARSKKETSATTATMSRYDVGVSDSNKKKTASPRVFQNDQDDEDSARRHSTSKLYPVSLTRVFSRTKARLPLTTNKNQMKGKGQPIKTEHGDSDDDEDVESTEGGSYSVPTLTVSYEDDVAQLAVTFSTSFRNETDDEEEDDEEGEPLFVSQTIGLHTFTLGADFSHPAAANPIHSKKCNRRNRRSISRLLYWHRLLHCHRPHRSTRRRRRSMSVASQQPNGRTIGNFFSTSLLLLQVVAVTET